MKSLMKPLFVAALASAALLTMGGAALAEWPNDKPITIVFPFPAIGVYSVNSNPFDLIVMSAFGAIGYCLTKLNCEPAPLLLGFVLGPMMEDYFRRTMLLSGGDATVFVTSPISMWLLVASAIVLVIVLVPSIRKRRAEVFVEATD